MGVPKWNLPFAVLEVTNIYLYGYYLWMISPNYLLFFFYLEGFIYLLLLLLFIYYHFLQFLFPLAHFIIRKEV